MASPKRPPNILLIMTDQQRFDALGAAGNPHIRTPNLDRLAADGVRFETTVTPCPVCVPARASLFSGLAPGRIGLIEHVESKPSKYPRAALPHALNAAGYVTHGVGKMHFTPAGEDYGMRGLELSEEMRGYRLAKRPGDVQFDDYDRFLQAHGCWGWEKPPEIGYNEIKPLVNPLPPELHVTRWCGDRAVRWLREKRPAAQSFFLVASFVKPHSPFDCPSHLTSLYDPAALPGPAAPAEASRGNAFLQRLIEADEWDLYSERSAQRAKAHYYANITFIDEQVGRILTALEEAGLAEDTLVAFTSDHGEMMGDRGLWFKSVGYEGSLRVPLILRWPGRLAAGRVIGGVASLLDLYPTFAAAAGLPDDELAGLRPGRDLLAAAETGEAGDFACAEINYRGCHLVHARTHAWKYLHYGDGSGEELYDLRTDPEEVRNLARDPLHAGQLAGMRQRVDAWLQRYGDPDRKWTPDAVAPAAPGNNGARRAVRPFSRMPWESRVPPGLLPPDARGWWWQWAARRGTLDQRTFLPTDAASGPGEELP